ncbi:hypothetical protein [Chitinophaga nivalis]|uniref:Uncharacterized protein n=1 Tax=Chitinophaga nivalis TaxID=2991709 RepID=A0ABT3IGN7_9BACT|nr:hypothetical protein [Chitinophaga nivalis]MCW3467175.1 hypothetical protein [Chitinophaga nivalis]MCW3483133.1 hypothetical protein [Chitinophaga nivalis]
MAPYKSSFNCQVGKDVKRRKSSVFLEKQQYAAGKIKRDNGLMAILEQEGVILLRPEVSKRVV